MNYWQRVSYALGEYWRYLAVTQYAEHMDSLFDGGEWSGPAHDAMRETAVRRIAVKRRVLVSDMYQLESHFAWQPDATYAAQYAHASGYHE
jgi:hypothetical protein